VVGVDVEAKLVMVEQKNLHQKVELDNKE